MLLPYLTDHRWRTLSAPIVFIKTATRFRNCTRTTAIERSMGTALDNPSELWPARAAR